MPSDGCHACTRPSSPRTQGWYNVPFAPALKLYNLASAVVKASVFHSNTLFGVINQSLPLQVLWQTEKLACLNIFLSEPVGVCRPSL